MAQPGLQGPPRDMSDEESPLLAALLVALILREIRPHTQHHVSASVLMWAALSSLRIPLIESTLQEKHSSLYLPRHALCLGVVRNVPLKRQAGRAGSHILKSCVPVSSQERRAGPLL